jgi:RNA polymerase sigma-70 factor (ECF subfamily)
MRLSERITQPGDGVEELRIDDFVEQRRIREAIAQLPQEQRDAVLLAFFRGKTHVEIAKELGQPLGTVKSRISLGLRKIGAALQAGTRE